VEAQIIKEKPILYYLAPFGKKPVFGIQQVLAGCVTFQPPRQDPCVCASPQSGSGGDQNKY